MTIAERMAARIDALREEGHDEAGAAFQAATELGFTGTIRLAPDADGLYPVFTYEAGFCTDKFVARKGEQI